VLERVVLETEAGKQAWAAPDRFLKTAIKEGFVIEDVFDQLQDK
jgi:hypothetical protein